MNKSNDYKSMEYANKEQGTSNTRSSWNSDFPWNMIFSILYMCASPVQCWCDN